MKERQKSLDRALEEAVSRALRDNLAPLQRTADDLHQAYADLVAACSSTRPTNALPAMLRAQTAASALAAGLSVLSNFVAVALKPRDSSGTVEAEDLAEAASSVAHAQARSAPTAVAEPDEETASEPVQEPPGRGHPAPGAGDLPVNGVTEIAIGRRPGRLTGRRIFFHAIFQGRAVSVEKRSGANATCAAAASTFRALTAAAPLR